MNIEEYEKNKYLEYQNFAFVVATILEAALKTDGDRFRLWEIQKRAKDSSSLRKKLLDRNLLDHPNIENEIKDLAGCRLIFYSNDDVNDFINSGIVNENFDVDWNKLKIHQPVEESQDAAELYRAHHYLVSLKDDRTNLPEYASFLNLKCEIQIQTILNHAWSETGHDVIYKPLKTEGFGTKQHEEIKARMARIMQEHLLPAGYEFQKVLHDFKRLSEGKKLFERDVLQAIESATDNNNRLEIIERFRDHVLPNYDDIVGIFRDVLQIASSAIDLARTTELKPISTPFGDFTGKTFEDVTNVALEIINFIRYIDPHAVFSELCNIYLNSKSDKEKELVLKTVSKLAKHNMTVWNKMGPAIQVLLARQLSGFNDDRLIQLRSVVIEIGREILKLEVEGTTSTYNTLTIHSDVVIVSDELKDTRRSVIGILQRLYKKSDQEAEKRNLTAAMSNATRLPMRGSSSDEMLIMILDDTRLIYEFYQTLVKNEQYEILQSLEHNALWDYRRGKQWIEGNKIGSATKDTVNQLILVIEQYRDSMNEDANFVRYKTLVGFQSAFPESWENSDFDLNGKDAYRSKKISDYVNAINSENADEWLSFIKFCSKTKSNDLAMFPTFTQFLELLSEKKPDIALGYIKILDDNLAPFLVFFLGGLWKSERKNEAKEVIDGWVKESLYLIAITRHYKFVGLCDKEPLERALTAAIATDNPVATIELVSACIEHHNAANSTVLINIFMQAIKFLSQNNDARWVNENWFRVQKSTLFDALEEAQIKIVLLNLVNCSSVEYQAEAVLSGIAKKYPEAVILYFNDRIQFNISDPDADKRKNLYLERYEEVPYAFHSLSEPLSVIPKQAVQFVRAWYAESKELFTYRGGKLLANIFPTFPEAFQAELIALVQTKSAEDIDFVCSILRNYKGEFFVHKICREIIIALPDGDLLRQGEIEVILESTGVVTGEFGMSDAYKRKKTEIEPWLGDENPTVVQFANRYIGTLDNQIAAEHRRAEQGIELRKRDFGE